MPMRCGKTLVLIGILASTAMAQAPAKKKAAPKRSPNPAYAQVEDTPGLPRVLILGDSISIGYTLAVRETLEGKANVHRPAANCGPTTVGLKSLDAWLGEGRWDLIHFNHGLHDLKFVDDQGKNTSPDTGTRQVPLDQYEANLETIVERLEETGATLIFATTTPVPAGEPQRKQGDERAYNDAALKVMRDHDVKVDDLHAVIAPRFDAYAIRPGNVHFSPEGYVLLGKQVAVSIEDALDAKK